MNEQHSAPQPKKERLIFLLIAYGLTFLMGLPLAIAQRGGYNTDVFPNAQMYYPATGVMLAYLAARRPSLPRRFFVFYLLNTAALVASCLGAVLAPGDVWLAAANLIVVAGSALAWVFLLTERKEKRAAAGLRWHGGVKALGFVALFILLRTAAVFLSMLPYGQLGEYLAYWSTPDPYLTFLLLIPNFFLSFLPFFLARNTAGVTTCSRACSSASGRAAACWRWGWSGRVAPAAQLLLLCARDRPAELCQPDHHLRGHGGVFWLGLHEDAEHLGAGAAALFQQQPDPGLQRYRRRQQPDGHLVRYPGPAHRLRCCLLPFLASGVFRKVCPAEK